MPIPGSEDANALDGELLLAATIASMRMNRPAVVFDAPASVAACARCQEAYAEARRVIQQAGGLTAWMEKIEGRAQCRT